MAWPAEKRQETRQRILESAAQLFTRKGFDQVSIGDVMKNADLTHGGFYSHFDSKEALYAESLQTASRKSFSYKLPESSDNDLDLMSQLLEAYLDMDHLKPEHPSCPLAFLATDVANKNEAVRDSYTKVYKRFVLYMDKLMANSSYSDKAFALSALMVGGVALARSFSDEKMAERLLEACREAGLKMITSTE
ncbi:TetR/AcrR family transcriptional regulator [Thiomicrorhabdus sp. ZW0627]|uniref:TetR/AcrR family transcriptional regulator n=1 Tax=Thiomicrorhabdus sp. ZW0627 TaxID=3039774 RepID=UPI002436FB41|nr:TetR/AcrR family transcriptional regulator [Thiomicrorhabdus sp. ZW0627]MDG6772859.1 TetR/AcrR family transcriptional regulator [Thiomicrorhabdus sp. ZW0627]